MRTQLAVVLVVGLLVSLGFAVPAAAQAAAQKAAPRPVRAGSQEMMAAWNNIGRKLVAMAEDFPEAQYDFKPQRDQRTFAEQLLHVVAEEYSAMSALKGAKVGPAQEPSRANYRTRADVAKLLKQAVADGAALIKEQGDAGLSREIKSPYGNAMVHAWFAWMEQIEHAGEHYGQLVVYYRVNNMVPPESRPAAK